MAEVEAPEGAETPETPETPSLADVISHAVETGDTSGTLGDETVEEQPEGEEVPEGEETPEGAEAEGDEPPEGMERDPKTGQFVKKVEAAAELGPDGKPKKPEGEGPKKPDPINDPIPKDLKQETQERIRTLISMNKEITQRVEKATQDFDYLVNGIKATGTTPQQYGEVLSFMALFNSGDPNQQAKALELIESVADRLATLLGKERVAGDPYKGHDDLRDAVAKGQITAQYAKEIARTRNATSFRTELQNTADQQRTTAENAERELTQARADLNALEATLKASDPQYAAKKAQILPTLKVLFKDIPPSKWKERFQAAYSTAQVAAAPKRVIPKNQPMRAGGGAGAAAGKGSGKGGMKQEPGSMLDAVNAALSEIGA